MITNEMEICEKVELINLYKKFESAIEVAPNLNRKLISFQTSKDEPINRWFKYKEGFSSEFVKSFLKTYQIESGKILDPFAGVGATLFAAREMGWSTYGIELLPVGSFVINTRLCLEKTSSKKITAITKDLWTKVEQLTSYQDHFVHVPITKGAFPKKTEIQLNKYLSYCDSLKDQNIKQILKFAAFCILEQISYTRKDGQYLRWDHRSKKNSASAVFDKGRIYNFEDAVNQKLGQIVEDLNSIKALRKTNIELNNSDIEKKINLFEGSCLEILPTYKDEYFDFIITSPPYCNRYDYTRTYALELVFLGKDNENIRQLRQDMLSCTVENKEKIEKLNSLYLSIKKMDRFERAMNVYNSSGAMNEINTTLNDLRDQERLNNPHVPRMVRNYFLEMCFTIMEMSRVTKPGGYCVMVNDNVQYGGEQIPVDLILSDFALSLNFAVKKIYVLPRGKGNSSQQMGNYGRSEIRKCVYVWQKI